jgi:hypothetical protein
MFQVMESLPPTEAFFFGLHEIGVRLNVFRIGIFKSLFLEGTHPEWMTSHQTQKGFVSKKYENSCNFFFTFF